MNKLLTLVKTLLYTLAMVELNENEVFTVEEVAKILGLKEQTVWNYIQLGKIKKTKFKTLTCITRSDLAEYQRLNQ